MENVIEDIYEEVKKRCMLPSNIFGPDDWNEHIKLVYEIATKNSKLYKADYTIVALASLLHDIASITNKDYVEEHHIIGAQIAEELLIPYHLEQKQIELIKQCIINHRGSKLKPKNTPEEICVADADAMAHFYSIPSLFKLVYVEKGMTIDEGIDFIYNKLQRSYNKLSTLGKEIIKPQYKAALVLLKDSKNI